MGFHVCEYCKQATSSGDVTLAFASGRSWVMPDMIAHYVEEHAYRPPPQFVADVVEGVLTASSRAQTKALPQPVGYLSGHYPRGETPPGFLEKLKGLMVDAASKGERVQTRGL